MLNCRCIALLLIAGLLSASVGTGAEKPLKLHFVDVEGGAAMIAVAPDGTSLLVDSGYPDYGGRDRDRILHVARDVAGLDHFDVAYVTHWHLDHYGNHAAIAAEFPIKTFYDRGIPDGLDEDRDFETRIAAYRQATQNQSMALSVGDELKLGSDVVLSVVTSGRNVARGGQPNPYADEHVAKPRDATDNAASLSFVLSFGEFRMLHCGDLTWNVEAALVTPNNPIGQVDLFMVTHHGLPRSNNPVLVKAIDPVTAVMCNGPTKGGHPDVLETLRACESLQALFQLHANVAVPLENQAPAHRIANFAESAACHGHGITVTVAADSSRYTISVADGKPETFATRAAAH